MPYKNPEDLKRHMAARRATDPDFVERDRARKLKSYYAHKEEISDRRRIRREVNLANGIKPESTPAKKNYNREYYEANPEKFAEYSRKQAAKVAAKKEVLAGRPKPETCDVCSLPGDAKVGIHWDHNHGTGKFRGWLCGSCNRALGLVKDSPELLRKLADYLENDGVEVKS